MAYALTYVLRTWREEIRARAAVDGKSDAYLLTYVRGETGEREREGERQGRGGERKGERGREREREGEREKEREGGRGAE